MFVYDAFYEPFRGMENNSEYASICVNSSATQRNIYL